MSHRVAFGRINQETNALSPLETEIGDFERTHFVEGDALTRACERRAHEVPGLFRNAELSGFAREMRRRAPGVELLPLISSWAVPGGPLSHECFAELRARLVRSLERAMPLDGVCLALHGAMGARGVRDPDGELLRAARYVVGPDVPIAVTYDLHGNMTKARIDRGTFHVAYHTNPHRDHARTGARAARLLLGAVERRTRPVTAWRSLPMLLGGGVQIDFLPPLRSVYALARRFARERAFLDSSLFTVHPWNDDPELGWSVVVHTDGDRALAERAADALAEQCWAIRDRLPPRFPPPEEAIESIRRARIARRLGVVVVSDASDVTSAGAPGENVAILAALLAAPDIRSFVPVRATRAVAELWESPVGARVRTRVGGTIDPRFPESIELDGVIERKIPNGPFDRVVVLRCDHLTAILTERTPLVLAPSFFTSAGLRVLDADVVVVKNFFPFLLYFLPYARKVIFVKTQGLTDWDAAYSLDFAGPIHPRDALDDWRPTDHRRRGLAQRE